MVFPLIVVAFFYAIGVMFTAFFAWVALLFTGRYPVGLYSFHTGALRLFTRVNAYYYLATDVYPPFSGEDDPSYPIRVSVGPPLESYSRVKVFFRWIIGIPVMFIGWVFGIIGMVGSIGAWFSIVFTGKTSPGLQGMILKAARYNAQSTAYFLYMTETYPPTDEPSVALPPPPPAPPLPVAPEAAAQPVPAPTPPPPGS